MNTEPTRHREQVATGPPGVSGGAPADHEPLRSFLDLGARAEAVPMARRHVRQMLAQWGLTDLAAKAEAVVSEIVTNGVQAAIRPGSESHPAGLTPGVCLWLEATGRQVRIEVWDDGAGRPQRRDPDPDAKSGRGLLLVEALSTSWGYFVPRGWDGKIVYAQIGTCLRLVRPTLPKAADQHDPEHDAR